MTMLDKMSSDNLYKWRDEMIKKTTLNDPVYAPLIESVTNELRDRGLPEVDPAKHVEF